MIVHFDCLVLGLNVTGLGVLQTLGARGVAVAALDRSRMEIGFHSCFGEKFLVADRDLIAWLGALEQAKGRRIVLFPSSDDYLTLLSEHRALLEGRFALPFPEPELLGRLLDKYQFHLLASPWCDLLPGCALLDRSTGSTWRHWPAIVKPVLIHEFRKQFPNTKAWVVQGTEELEEKRLVLERLGIAAVVQEIVVGPDSDQFSVCGYFDAASRPTVSYVARKVRQDPRGFGVGTYVELVEDPGLLEPTHRLLQRLNFTGIAEVEYRRDARTGSFKLIEVNARAWTQNKLGAYAGHDVVGAAYSDLSGKALAPLGASARRWAFVLRDLKGLWCDGGPLVPRLRLAARVIFPGPEIVHAVYDRRDPRVLLGVPLFFLWKLSALLRSRGSNG